MTETITVLVVEPGRTPYAKEILPGLKSLQREVGGHIEAVYPFPEPAAIVCLESGKLDGCPLNRALRDETGTIYDIIAGTFLVVGLTEEDFSSLSPELLQTFSQRFQNPEAFMMLDGQLLAFPPGGRDMILEDLWSGSFYPAETVVPTDPVYREVNRAISEKMERLQAQLPQEQFTLVEQILEQMALAHSMELESHFCFGFAAGVRLQQEIDVFISGKKQR